MFGSMITLLRSVVNCIKKRHSEGQVRVTWLFRAGAVAAIYSGLLRVRAPRLALIKPSVLWSLRRAWCRLRQVGWRLKGEEGLSLLICRLAAGSDIGDEPP